MQFRALITTGSTPSSSAIFGTAGSAELLRTINDRMGSTSFFGSMADRNAEISNHFIQNIVAPIQATIQVMAGAITSLSAQDVFRPLTTFDDFQYVPPCMYESLIFYPPMKRMLEQGRIEGWGYDADNLTDEDRWGRLIKNGVVEDVLEAHAGDDDIIYEQTFDSGDPDWDLDKLDAVESARRTIDRMMAETQFDPSNYPMERG